jgi:hypothetical protein
MVALNLTPKQIAYADGLLDGKTGSDAYRTAYDTRGNNRVVARKAADLKKHPAVQHYLQSMRAESQTEKVLSRHRVLEVLSEMVEDMTLLSRDRIRAIDTLSKLEGWYAPQKTEVQETGSLLDSIRAGGKTGKSFRKRR